MAWRPSGWTVRWLCLLCLGPLAGLAPPAHAQEIPVRDALSYSFASGLVASPAGERIAWVENREGARNVWVAEGPAWEARRVTDYTSDDGQELGGLVFTSDGRHLLYVRGGAPNRQGEVPNPRSTPEVEERATWIVDVAGGTPRRLMEGGGAVPAPHAARIAYARSRDLFVLDLEDGARPVRIARIRGSAGGLTWSPDGSRLAFVSHRGDHAFIGVFDFQRQELRYLDPSLARDQSPVWSPDGGRIAFLRIPNQRVVHLFAPRREGLPFSVRVVDVATGEAREVWRAPEGPGSVFSGINAERQLFWTGDGRLVFPWEGTGWKLLYALPVEGGGPVALTPGDHEVQFAAQTPDGAGFVYDSNLDDIDRKHVWRVGTDGAPRLLTPGEGIEWGAVETPGGAVAFMASDARTPAHVEVWVDGARRWVSPPQPASVPTERFVVPRPVIFSAADGMRIHGQLFLPPDYREGRRYPAVLFFHGGSRRQMLLGFHHRGYYHNAYAFNQVLASAGFIVLSVNYRSGIGYGLNFREALHYGATGASEFNDVTGAGLYLRSRDDVDPDRIGLWGGSYGGYLTALGLARASHLFAAGVDLHGVHDWNQVIRGFRPSYEPEDYPEFSRVAFQSSPLAHVDGWRSPVLLIHGDDDRNVPFSESVDLAEELARRGVDFEQLVFPDEVHGFLLHRSWVAAYEAALDFFRRRLAGG